jgi:drug/metabolite transporter (DMT)-like permease
VLIAALTYAAYFMIGARYTREIGSTRFTLFAMTAATVAIVIHATVRNRGLGLDAITPGGWMLLGAISIVCMFVPALMQAEGLKRVGAERGSVLSTAGPPTTLLLAWILLGERMTAWQLGGMALIVGGILVLDLAKSR